MILSHSLTMPLGQAATQWNPPESLSFDQFASKLNCKNNLNKFIDLNSEL